MSVAFFVFVRLAGALAGAACLTELFKSGLSWGTRVCAILWGAGFLQAHESDVVGLLFFCFGVSG